MRNVVIHYNSPWANFLILYVMIVSQGRQNREVRKSTLLENMKGEENVSIIPCQRVEALFGISSSERKERKRDFTLPLFGIIFKF